MGQGPSGLQHLCLAGQCAVGGPGDDEPVECVTGCRGARSGCAAKQGAPAGELDLETAVSELCFAAHAGEVAIVQALLRQGLDVNSVDYDRRCALHVAAADGQAEVVDVLLSARADVEATDRWGRTALEEAVRCGSLEVQALLRLGGADSSGQHLEDAGEAGENAGEASDRRRIEVAMSLCCAAAAGALPLIRELKNTGADVSAGDYDGRTALHVASAHGHVEVVELLLSLRADVHQRDSFGLTPLSDAMRHHRGAVADLLAREGASGGTDRSIVQLSAFSEHWAIPASEIRIGSVLSTTLKSVIYRATWRGTEVVAKTSSVLQRTTTSGGEALVASLSQGAGLDSAATELSTSTEDNLQETLHEIQLLSTLRHPDLVLFLGACFDHSTPFFITEYMEGGDLERHYMAQARRLGHPYCPPGAKLMQWGSAVARALTFLHGCSRPIIHRDLKPLNLLLSRSGDVKVTDFGISKLMAPRVPGAEKNAGSIHSAPLMSGGVGTWRYMAPEVVRYQQYTDRVDIYSFALILWFMCTGRQPFVEQFGPDAEVVLKEYIKGNEPRPDIRAVGGRLPMALHQLIRDCWHATPAARPSASECTQRLAALCARDDSGLLTSLLSPLSGLFARRQSP